MNPGELPLIKALQGRMAWLGQREQVLAQNVANADTPGYLAQDIKAPSFRDLVAGGVSRLPLAVTDGAHLPGTHGALQARAEPVRKAPRTLSGNSVDIEQEMMKISETASDHHLVTNLYKRNIDMLRAALGRSGG
jgi:flagellar basal-body rod protein FlgB